MSYFLFSRIISFINSRGVLPSIMTKDALRVTRRYSKLRGRERSPRPKTFASEEAAVAWAKAQGYTTFHVENLRSSEAKQGKFRVVVEI